jgi:hypothetical protein
MLRILWMSGAPFWKGMLVLKYFNAFTFFKLSDFNYLGKALPKDVQIDTGAFDQHKTLEDSVPKELAKWENASSTALLCSTFSIEGSEHKLVIELTQCTIYFGNAPQKGMGTQIPS